MRGGPADIGLYIVQTDGRSWPFIVKLALERERAAPFLTVFGAIHGLSPVLFVKDSRLKGWVLRTSIILFFRETRTST
jgi:hypothetical protein